MTLEGLPPLNDDVRARLQALRSEGWRIAVVSNGESGVQEATAERIGVLPLLDACVVSETVGSRKPDAAIFEYAAAACGATLEGAWMIGDSEDDVAGAAGVGATSIWLNRGRTWTRADVHPDHVAASLVEALDLVG